MEDYRKSKAKNNGKQIPYYFGHFLFEKKSDEKYAVIDGQQRLTTIVIFLSALFAKLRDPDRKLEEEQETLYEDIIKRKSIYRFSTVDYDDLLLKDYVINETKKDKNGIDTTSAKRIVDAYDYFKEQLKDKDKGYLKDMLGTITQASCTTHQVTHESEAIQMFIFQNNRGKKPTNLEIIKAQFMYNIHLHGGDEKDSLLNEIKERFHKIYKSIASIEYKISEDDVLVYTLRVHFNSLWETNAIDKIERELSNPSEAIKFIKAFTQA